MSSKKHKDKTTLNNEQRKEVIEHKEKHPSISHIDLASWITKHGEEASVDDNIIATAIPKLRELLGKYNLKDIYNIDETGLFYQRNDTNEVLDDQEIVDLVTSVESEKKSNYEKNDNSIEIRQIIHQGVLNAIELLEQYLFQQDFGEATRLEHDEALLKLQKSIRKF
ncbi:28941_t:CDS:2 [Gigaspora margarita]|uniref:28941_t:CDS:1 n=1 Tax=Gigaspora margarita TaxID=4874 RepID=A0ABN7W0V2_GIGMA|nr:28941_t:CDS:2 [Gigaspora margarita]